MQFIFSIRLELHMTNDFDLSVSFFVSQDSHLYSAVLQTYFMIDLFINRTGIFEIKMRILLRKAGLAITILVFMPMVYLESCVLSLPRYLNF